MIKEKQGYSYGDLMIIPSITSGIKSRSECTPKYTDNMYPLFTAPMSSVLGPDNWDTYESHGIIPVIPRTVPYTDRIQFESSGLWCAFGIQEFKQFFIETAARGLRTKTPLKALLDIANGHMEYVLDLVREAKKNAEAHGYTLVVMAGNIANPRTYAEYAKAGVDYIRVGVGGGSDCLTTSNTGIHYPMASLVNDCYTEKCLLESNIKIFEKAGYKNPYKSIPKIVADGGVRGYSDIIKALALGADYVMVGSVFSGLYESTAKFLKGPSSISDSEETKREAIKEGLTKEFYGMSTKKAQSEISGRTEGLKTSEGCIKEVPVHSTIRQWTENFDSYLRSAMSYCDSRDLGEFIGKPDLGPVSLGTQERVNK